MYGTTRKSYSISRASRIYEDNTVKGLAEKNKKSKQKHSSCDDLQQTSYIKINEVNEKQKTYPVAQETQKRSEGFSKNEFPVASVILTIVFTMMILVFAFGFGGI